VFKTPFAQLGILQSSKRLIDEDGLVTLSVISHGHTEEIETLLDDIARCKIRNLAQIVITLNLSEERPRVPRGIDVPIHWCGNPYPKGFGANHNAAFRYCNTEFFAVVNPDIRFDSDPFSPLLEHAGKDFGLVAPRVLDKERRIADAARGLITPWEIVSRRLRPRAPLRYPAWMAGMFLVFRAEAYRGVSGFDERFHLYCEDFDICARVRLLGWPISLCDHARVIHDARRASHDTPQHLFWHVCSLMRMWTTRAWWKYRKLLQREFPHRLPVSTESDQPIGLNRSTRALPSGQRAQDSVIYPSNGFHEDINQLETVSKDTRPFQ
jgi:GT2 family glycosyltransferase